MKLDAEKVVAGCRKHDAKAQKVLYDEFAPMMLGVCMRYTHSRDEAQDLLHDGFIKVFENIGSLRNPQAVESWIYQIMVNVSLNYVMRRQALRYVDMDALEEDTISSEYDDSPVELDDELVAKAVRILQELPERYRVAFNLREVEEWEYSDIAERLGVKETSVRSLVARARKMILERL